jgi:hypothetical protein
MLSGDSSKAGGETEIPFGKHKGKKLKDLCKQDSHYLLWLAGVTTKFSLTSSAQEAYKSIELLNKETLDAAKDFVRNKCYRCWEIADKSHFCHLMKHSSFHHYHPYGKRI